MTTYLVVTEFWAGLLTFVLFLALVTIWAFVLTDLFMRKGMSGWKKAAWIVAVIFFPFIGGLLYLVTRKPSAAEIEYMNRAIGEQAKYIEGAAEQIERLKSLRQTGEISEQEYQSLRDQVIMGRGRTGMAA